VQTLLTSLQLQMEQTLPTSLQLQIAELCMVKSQDLLSEFHNLTALFPLSHGSSKDCSITVWNFQTM
jgi:hypothetical protein